MTTMALWSVAVNSHENHRHNDDAQPEQLSLDKLEDKILSLQYIASSESDLARLAHSLEQAPTGNRDETVHRLYLTARLQQHQHDFQAAKNTLTQALNLSRHNPNLLLLNASVLNNLGKHEEALGTCEQLLGLVGADLVSACVIDTRMQLEPHNKAQQYQDLRQIVALIKSASLRQDYWINEILAELALDLDKPDMALTHLNQAALTTAPVSYIALWADVHFALEQHQQVLDKLTDLTRNQSPINDALLLRLAMAEKFTQSGHRWFEAMQARIGQRSAEHNYAHAAEVAKFYLYVASDPRLASYWAKLNAQHAKSATDMALLHKTGQQAMP